MWVEELGWPWPKHGCFDSKPEPSWSKYLRANTSKKVVAETTTPAASEARFYESSSPSGFVGVVVAALRFYADGKALIALAIEGGGLGRRLVFIDGDSTADYYLGCIAVLIENDAKVVLSNHKTKPLLAGSVALEQLGLPSAWLE